MSHIVSIKTRLHDQVAISAACRRLGLAEPVLGTATMYAGQTAGHIDAIDQRSDIYSLGAILYEMLTLQAPVDKEGGYLAVLMRVVEGEIIAPEQRVKSSTQRKQIPSKELSAIAMKALAKNKERRDANVEAMRQDVERFQDGRSVSAKEDTKWELLWKLVKATRGSARAWRRQCWCWWPAKALVKAKKAEAAAKTAEDETVKRTRDAVPAFVAAARMWVENRNLDEALKQVDLAILYDSKNLDAYLLKGQVLIAQKKFDSAIAVLDRYLELKPDDANAKELSQLCRQANPEDGNRLLALYEVLVRQKALVLSDYLKQDVVKLIQSREKLLGPFRKRIEASWPKLGDRLKVEKDGKMSLHLGATGSQVRDLSPLRNMPLDSLFLNDCTEVRDLTPLQTMKLTELDLGGCAEFQDLAPLRGMKLAKLSLWNCDRVRDSAPLRGMPLTQLLLSGCKQVRDLTPLQGMKLHTLDLGACGQVEDLTPLQGMPLTWLGLEYCNQVRDLTPLRGMKLVSLGLPNHIADKDLTVLQGMPPASVSSTFNDQLRDLWTASRSAAYLAEFEILRRIERSVGAQAHAAYPVELSFLRQGPRPDAAGRHGTPRDLPDAEEHQQRHGCPPPNEKPQANWRGMALGEKPAGSGVLEEI